MEKYLVTYLGTNYIVYDRKTIPNFDGLVISKIDDDKDSEIYKEGYENINGFGIFSLQKFKNKKKEEIRSQRTILLQQLDALYFIESEKIYVAETFQRTPEMDEIMRKKKVLRDFPQQIDALATEAEVRAFVIPTSLDQL